MRSYEFTKMDEARREQEIAHNLRQAELKLSCQIDEVNQMREQLGKTKLELTHGDADE
jgi:hypothetical protein